MTTVKAFIRTGKKDKEVKFMASEKEWQLRMVERYLPAVVLRAERSFLTNYRLGVIG